MGPLPRNNGDGVELFHMQRSLVWQQDQEGERIKIHTQLNWRSSLLLITLVKQGTLRSQRWKALDPYFHKSEVGRPHAGLKDHVPAA